MTRNCWCGHARTQFIHGCAVCSIVARGFTGLPNSDFPRDEQIAPMNHLLKEGRGLPEEQRFQMLVERLSIDSELPRAFRTKRGRASDWNEDEAREWQRYLRLVEIHGSHYVERLPLPGGSHISVDFEGGVSIDGMNLPGPLPLRDIAIWLSNPARARRISDWAAFLMAMSCCMRKFALGVVDDIAHWFRISSWHGIDSRIFDEMQDLSVRHLQHPYLKWNNLMEQHRNGEDAPNREFFEADVSIIDEQGGRPAEGWLPFVQNQEQMIDIVMNKIVVPKLVVVNGRFCLLVLRDGKLTPLPVPVDARIWRLLVSWTLEPPTSKGYERLNHLLWCWHQEQETWTLKSNQSKSIHFLREAVETLGEGSSLDPTIINPDLKALRVQGRSAILYLILPTMHPRKFDVRAIPNDSLISEVMERGLHLCIDSQANHDIPCADIAVSYLLSLHNDVDSNTQVHTVRCMLDMLKKYPNWQKRSTTSPSWWDELVERYLNEDPEYYEEDEEPWDDGYEEYADYEEDPDWHDIEFETAEEIEENRAITRSVIVQSIEDLTPEENELRGYLEILFERFGGNRDDLEGVE